MDEGGALAAAGRIAASSGAALLCETWFPRLDRGGDRPKVQRLPYFPNEARKALSAFDVVVLVDCKKPVVMFAYEGGLRGPTLLPQPEDNIWELDCLSDIPGILGLLARELKPAALAPPLPYASPFVPSLPPPQSGRLNASKLCLTLARVQPESCIVVDESLTSGSAYFSASAGCHPFSQLVLTGGAIGSGPTLSVGAALACPTKRVINFQSDGAGLYSAVALWTQAKERLKITTVICSNRAYQVRGA